jgi:hypothetical protein
MCTPSPAAVCDPPAASVEAILHAIRRSQRRAHPSVVDPMPERLASAPLADYQRHLCSRFAAVIAKPSFDYIHKDESSWLIVGDRRKELEADIQLIIERHGLGVAMLVLHLQQLGVGHIPMEITENGHRRNLGVPSERLAGERDDHFLFVPGRRFRSDAQRLSELSVAKPPNLWDKDGIITHERDRHPCFYCSCAEINPAEVVVGIEGARHGLSRNYSLGFTFSPFGNPLTTVHFLAWDRSAHPLNMNRVPMTVSDLVKLTREINVSIRAYFADTCVRDFPFLEGVSNGWAGCSIFHQHFQFFVPERPLPVTRALQAGPTLVRRDDVTVTRLLWPAPVYRIHADDPLNSGLVGNDLAGIWRLLGGSRRFPYKQFKEGHTPAQEELVPAHTQNVHVQGSDFGATVHLILRDRERVDYLPPEGEFINREAGHAAQAKKNLGVLEASGMVFVDDPASFDSMREWPASDVSRQIHAMITHIAPDPGRVSEFESAAAELFPQ